MKKSIIAAGAASVALAAMPIVGVFADSTTDTINATLSSGCSVTDAVAAKTVNLSVAPGALATSPAAASISIVCNNNTWSINAVGSGTASHENALTQVKDGAGSDVAIADAEFIATGTETSGSTSNWAFKVASLTGVENTAPGSKPNAAIAANADPDDDPSTDDGYNYGVFSAIPAAGDAKTIVTGAAAANITVNTQYQLYAAISQAGGTYTGQVTYTVAES